MKKILYYIAAALFLTACAHENAFVAEKGENTFSFKLISSQPSTKATGDKLAGSTKESRVASIDYYFYADPTQEEIYHGTYPPANPDDPDFTFNPDARSWELDFEVGKGELAGLTLNDLFPGGAPCTVFFVANYPDAPDGVTLSDLQNLSIDQNFATITGTSEKKGNVLPENNMANFCMTALVEMAPDGTGNFAAEPIEVGLERVAVKMDFEINVKPKLTFNKKDADGDYEEIWEAMYEGNNVRVYLQNAVSNAVLGAGRANAEEGYYFPDVYDQFDYDPTYPMRTEGLVNGKHKFTSSPFYTYPMRWTKGDSKEPFIKVIVPWQVTRFRTTEDGERIQVYGNTKEMYYKVMLPENVLNANDWYKVIIDIAVLGNEAGDPEVEIPAEFVVIPWIGGAGDNVNSDILGAKYLSVDVRKINDENVPFQIYSVSGSTTYASSDKVTMEIVDIYQYDMKNYTNVYLYQNGGVVTNNLNKFHTIDLETGEERQLTAADVTGWVTHQENAGGGLVEIKHMLNNDMLSDYFDATEYVYTIKLTLTTDATYTETIQFIQYPALYITSYASPSSQAFVKSYNNNNSVYDDGSGDNRYRYMGSITLNGGGNGITAMRNISVSVSVLTAANKVNGQQMVIGDPRGPVTSLPLTGLSNYRPTDSSKNNYVAPKFLIASGRGTTNPTTYEGALKRCAAYQENGYPAGRWRLPTMAEVQFLISLSEKGKIDKLFDPSSTDLYWAAGYMGLSTSRWIDLNGVTPNSNYYYNSTYRVWPRCVYDEWYWAQYDEKNDPLKENDLDKLANPANWGGYQPQIHTSPIVVN